MKKIMFNDRFSLTESVLFSEKTQTRRIAPKDTPLDNWEETIKHAHYSIGEVVAVAQSYRDIETDAFVYGFSFNLTDDMRNSAGYKNKMFVKAELMPHYIEITNIRAERLQDISDEDCLAEGIYKPLFGDYTFDLEYGEYKTPRKAYKALIDNVIGKGTYDSNPWVFAYDFELIK